jgi:hypothetical protein
MVRASPFQFNSIQAFSIGLTPTGACMRFRNVFLMCFSTLARTPLNVACSMMHCRGGGAANPRQHLGWLFQDSTIVQLPEVPPRFTGLFGDVAEKNGANYPEKHRFDLAASGNLAECAE